MPVIRFGFKSDPALAVGTTLTAVVFAAASGAIQHRRMKNVDTETSLSTGYSGILGIIIGSIIKGVADRYDKNSYGFLYQDSRRNDILKFG